ncbi:MAG: molecular chaperone TorD family protein [Desulfobacterales bacterium]|nr:molecular chaperone TorD family protein [Desulfobacterales bacterium]
MDIEIFMRHEAIRSEIYKLLADCYYPPDESLSSKIMDLDEKLELVCPQTWQDMGWSGTKILKADNMEVWKVEYARLFVGPYTLHAPPYGSVYLDSERRIMGNSTMDVVDRYREAGLIPAKDFKDAPDHIAAELEFMHFLIFKAMNATRQNDGNKIITHFLNQQSFLEDHLAAWVPEFTRNVVENAKTSFYRNLGRATEAFIKEDYHIISSVLTFWSANTDKSAQAESFSAQY